jgi:pimeloyl-ACP methyl ester carboxylesterase
MTGFRLWTKLILIASVVIILIAVGCSSLERKLLFFPTHRSVENGLIPWTNSGELIGYARKVDSPRNVWLLIHGNGGQAADRAYALPSFSAEDSVFILEYPGYGSRKGKPSKKSLDAAAREAYLLLRKEHPMVPVCVAGESIGSGPSASLANLNPPPDKLVLIVPFDKLSLVAKEHVPALLVTLLLSDNWDNIKALSNYKGPVDIFGAEDDTIVPIHHAKALASAVPSSKLVTIHGGHNDWARDGKVTIRNP